MKHCQIYHHSHSMGVDSKFICLSLKYIIVHIECRDIECRHIECRHIECRHIECRHIECKHIECRLQTKSKLSC